MKNKFLLPLALLVLPAYAPAQRQPTFAASASRPAALEPGRAARIDQLLQRYVDENRIAGAVALVLRDGKPVYERAVGWADEEAGRRMNPSTIFRIASQTKAITSTAVLALVEEGKIELNEPVGHFIPPFSKTTVAVKSDSGITIVPARRAITIKDLLTHTAGISYGTDKQVSSLYEAKGLGPAACSGKWGACGAMYSRKGASAWLRAWSFRKLTEYNRRSPWWSSIHRPASPAPARPIRDNSA